MALTDKLKAIADAIRNKTGKTDVLTLSQIPNEIASIPTGNATEPFTEETYDDNRTLVSAKMVGHTFVRPRLFIDCFNLTTVDFPNVTIIDNAAFSGCTRLALTELPAWITYIGTSAFYNCSNLALTELPAGITYIGTNAFYNCSNLALTELPAGITYIGTNAFTNCSKIVSITFKGTPTNIDSFAFYSTNLTTINVPWSEGAVANAPWGAANATINYDYVAPET